MQILKSHIGILCIRCAINRNMSHSLNVSFGSLFRHYRYLMNTELRRIASSSLPAVKMPYNQSIGGISLTNSKNRDKGQIQVIFGPMFSGKTSELIRRLNRYAFAQYRCLIIKYVNDNRYSHDCVATHDGLKIPAITLSNLYSIASAAESYDVIGIDEGQFFQDSIVDFVEEMANRGKIVIVASLDSTYKRTEFGKILQLVPIAESVVKLNAVCMSCFQDAAFTKRISSDSNVELIGGVDKYMAVCRECYRLKQPIRNSPRVDDTSNAKMDDCNENILKFSV